MGILADQRFRLLREEWTSPLELAQEIYEMFGADGPFQIDGPVQIKNDTAAPAVSIASNGLGGDGGTVFSITRGRDPDVTFSDVLPDVAPASIPSAGGSGGGGGTPAVVVSGSGSTYAVRLYPDGVTAGSTVAATQLQIDPADAIPAGSWVFVTKLGGRYFFQAAVWL